MIVNRVNGNNKSNVREKVILESYYIQRVTHIVIWYYVTYVTVSHFGIYQLGFSVSPSNHLSDQQNLGSDSCNVLKETKSFHFFYPSRSVSLYTKQYVGGTDLHTWYEIETYNKTTLGKRLMTLSLLSCRLSVF